MNKTHAAQIAADLETIAIAAERRKAAAKTSKPKEDPKTLPNYMLEHDIGNLRYSARCAYLDGSTKRAKALNKKADALAKIIRDRAKKATA